MDYLKNIASDMAENLKDIVFNTALDIKKNLPLYPNMPMKEWYLSIMKEFGITSDMEFSTISDVLESNKDKLIQLYLDEVKKQNA